MRSRGSANRLSNSGGSSFYSRISALILSMFATMATIYVAGRLVIFLFPVLFSLWADSFFLI